MEFKNLVKADVISMQYKQTILAGMSKHTITKGGIQLTFGATLGE